MKTVLIAGVVVILLAIACGIWAYMQGTDASDAERLVEDIRAGRSGFENDPGIKQTLLEVADRDAKRLRTRSQFGYVAAAIALLAGTTMCIVAATRRSPAQVV